MAADQLELAGRLATQLRVDSIRCSTQAGSGHPTSSLSAADLMAVLMLGHLRYDWQHPDLPGNDHLIFSKGHASPLLYSMFRAAGAVDEDELITTYRQLLTGANVMLSGLPLTTTGRALAPRSSCSRRFHNSSTPRRLINAAPGRKESFASTRSASS